MSAVPCPVDDEQKERSPMPFRALEMIGYCRHCGIEITMQRFGEFQACSNCSSGDGWETSDGS